MQISHTPTRSTRYFLIEKDEITEVAQFMD